MNSSGITIAVLAGDHRTRVKRKARRRMRRSSRSAWVDGEAGGPGMGRAVEPGLGELDQQQVHDDHPEQQQEERRRQRCEAQQVASPVYGRIAPTRAAPVGTRSIGQARTALEEWDAPGPDHVDRRGFGWRSTRRTSRFETRCGQR